MERQVEGRRAVQEALRAGRTPDKLFVLRSAEGLGALLREARGGGAVIVECDRARLDAMSLSGGHQGVIGTFTEQPYATLTDIFARAEQSGRPPLLVVCDGVEDEGNLGAIIRSAEAAGAHGVVIPKRRSAGLSPVTIKTSAGATEHLPVVRVPGIPACLRELKEHGLWLYGTAAESASSVFDTNFNGPVALVVGSEGEGLSRLASELCDFHVSIPMLGQVGSLNVSAATAVLLYSVVRCRQLTNDN